VADDARRPIHPDSPVNARIVIALSSPGNSMRRMCVIARIACPGHAGGRP
jgi:hypothetical protein